VFVYSSFLNLFLHIFLERELKRREIIEKSVPNSSSPLKNNKVSSSVHLRVCSLGTKEALLTIIGTFTDCTAITACDYYGLGLCIGIGLSL
jgi:hypothetical protein